MSLLLESDIQIGASSIIVSIAEVVVEEPEKMVEEVVAEVVVVAEKPAKRKK